MIITGPKYFLPCAASLTTAIVATCPSPASCGHDRGDAADLAQMSLVHPATTYQGPGNCCFGQPHLPTSPEIPATPKPQKARGISADDRTQAPSKSGICIDLVDAAVALLKHKDASKRAKALSLLDAAARGNRITENEKPALIAQLILHMNGQHIDTLELHETCAIAERLMRSIANAVAFGILMRTLDTLSEHENPLIRTYVLAVLPDLMREARHDLLLFGYFIAATRFGDPDVTVSMTGRDIAKGISGLLSPVDRLALAFMECSESNIRA